MIVSPIDPLAVSVSSIDPIGTIVIGPIPEFGDVEAAALKLAGLIGWPS
jgi:hypothetical protein